MRARYWIAVLVIVGLVGLAGYVTQHAKPAQLQLGQVSRADLVETLHISGHIAPKRSVLILPPYDGYIKQLFVQLGDSVKLDQPLVSVVQYLQGSESVHPMVAPFAGNVVQLLKREGEHVNKTGETDYIMRIDDVSQFFVKANVVELDINKLRLGQKVIVKPLPLADKVYQGVLREINLAGSYVGEVYDRNKVVYAVQIQILDPDHALKPDMSVVADIVAAKAEQVLVLGHEYVQHDPTGNFVTLANGQKRQIEIGLQNDRWIEIKSGLVEGEQVQLVDFLTQES